MAGGAGGRHRVRGNCLPDWRALTATVLGPDGTIYQSAYGSNHVYAIAPDGTILMESERISGPTGIVVRDDGSLLVESYTSNKIVEVQPDGTVSDWTTAPGLRGPNGFVAGPDGTMYAVNHRNGGLFQVDPDGTVTELLDFPKPTSHVAYLDGGLFVTSRGAYVVYRYDLETGEVEIVAGNGVPGDQDGRGTEASFGRPNAITVGPDGALYTNHGTGIDNFPVSIRRISYDPT